MSDELLDDVAADFNRSINLSSDESITEERPKKKKKKPTHDSGRQIGGHDNHRNDTDVPSTSSSDPANSDKAFLDGKFFTLVNSTSDGSVKATCTSCKKIISGTIRTSSNFKTHLKNVHPGHVAAYTKHVNERVLHGRVVKEKTKLAKKSVRSSFDQTLFNKNVTNYILDSMAPLQTVESPSFRKIFNDLNVTQPDGEKLKHLTTRRLKTDIDARFAEDRRLIRDSVKNEAKFYCTTADIWSAKTRSFLGVTLHWIDPETLKRKSAAIACKRFAGTHSFDRIAESVDRVHKSFELDAQKLVATVTDNATNFVKAFKEYGISQDESEDLDEESDTPSDEEHSSDTEKEKSDAEPVEDDVEADELKLPKHLRCSSHTLNLIATTDMSKIIKKHANLSKRHKKLISRCTELWNKTRSPKQLELLTKSLGCSLRRPVVTRWNSLFDSLTVILKVREKFTPEFYERMHIEKQFGPDDLEYLEEFVNCMTPLAKTIDLLQGEEHYGTLLPALVSLKNDLQEIASKEHKYISALCKGLLGALETRLHDFFEIEGAGCDAAIAAALHPDFKLRWVKSLPKTVRAKVRPLIVNTAKDFGSLIEKEQPAVEDKFNFTACGDSDSVGSENSMQQVSVESMILNYLQEPCTKELLVVKQNPLIFELFLRYNTALPSSAPVERLFSFATLMNLPKYNRLSDTTFEKRVLCKANHSSSFQ